MKSKLKFIIPIVIAVIAIIVAALCIDFTPQERADVSSIMSTAQKYLIENQYEQAIAKFNKVIEIEPKNVDAYLGLAEAYVGMGDTDKAIEILEKGYSATNDNRLKEMLDSLSGGSPDVTTELQQSDSESILFYSDGTVRCQKTFLSDGGYELKWFEPNANCMLTETYNSSDKIIYAVYKSSFEGIAFTAEAVPEVSENGYTISSDYFGKINYEFNFDGRLIKTIDSPSNSSKRITSYEYPSEKKIIADFSYNYNDFYSYTKEEIEYIDNRKIKITYFRDNFTLGYSITEIINAKKHKISYYEEDNTLVGYRNLEYTDNLNKMTMYSADGRLLSEGEYKKDGYKYTKYDLDGKVYSTNSAEYKNNQYISYFNNDAEYEVTTEWLSDGSIKRTYSGYMYDEREVEIEKYTDNGYTVTRYDKDGNVISVTTYENNSSTQTYTDNNGNYSTTIGEWINPTQLKYTHYDESKNMTGYALLNYNSSMYMFWGMGYMHTYKYYSSDGILTLETEYDDYGNSKGTYYNDDGTISGTFVDTRSNGIYYKKYYTANGKLSQESEEDLKGNSKGTYYNDDGTVSGTFVATRNNGISYTKHYNTDGTLSSEYEHDNKGNSKSTSYYPNGTVSYISSYSNGINDTYSYDENGKLISHTKYDKNGNEIS